jgi:hypothetical protein
MARGTTAAIGDTRVAPNQYHYTKTEDGWRLTHHITAEKALGRPLRDNEMVQFIEPKYKRDPENPQGIRIIKKRTTTLRKRRAILTARIEQDQRELAEIEAALGDK